MWKFQKLFFQKNKLSISDLAVKYRNVSLIVDISQEFNYDLAIKIQKMGYLFLWIPGNSDISFLQTIVLKAKKNNVPILIASSSNENNVIQKRKQILKIIS